MTKIYFLNTREDIQAFANAFPDSRWMSGRPLNITEDFSTTNKPPIALYKFANNRIAWDYIRYAREKLADDPYQYVLTALPKCLSLVEVFYTFLKHHKSYSEYLYDIAHHSFHHKPIITTSRLLSSTIDLLASDRFSHWISLHNKWSSLVNDLQLPEEIITSEFFEQLSLMEKLHD